MIYFCSGIAVAQVPHRTLPGLTPTKPISQFFYDHWTDENGLPQNSCWSIAQTPDGYLWFATFDGVLRFDGSRFVTFNNKTASRQMFKVNEIKSLLADKSGGLWIGTGGGGLIRYKNHTFTRHIADTIARHNFITALYQDHSGRLWAGTGRSRGGLVYFTDSSYSSFKEFQGIKETDIYAIVEDARRRLWVGTDLGLYCIEGNSVKLYTSKDGLSDNLITALATDNDGNLWIGTNTGLHCWHEGVLTTWTTNTGLNSNAISALFVDKNNALWVGSNDGGLHRIYRGVISLITRTSGLSSNTILSLFEDHEGSLWIGTGGSGIDRIKEPKLTTFGKPEGYSSDIFSVTYQDSKGYLWAGSFFSNDIHRFYQGKIQNFTSKDGIPGHPVRSIYEDRQGRMWFGTQFGGIVQFANNVFATYSAPPALLEPINDVRAIHEDNKGRLWVGTFGGGLGRLDNKTLVPVYTTANGLGSNYIFGICEDQSGRFWIATRGGGVTVLQPDSGVVAVYNTTNGLLNNNVVYVVRDRQNTIWLGTQSGIMVYHKGRFLSLTTQNGLPDDATFVMLQDQEGNYWFSCSTGIITVSRQDMQVFLDGTVKTVNAKRYDKSDGMRSTECNGGGQPAGCLTRDGTLWIPTMKGLVTFNPQKLRLNVRQPDIHIEEIEADGKTLYEHLNTSVLPELPAGMDRVTIHFTLLSFLFPEKVQFQYRMEGLDKDWSPLSEKRTAEYTNLSAGMYTFHVRGCNNDGIWNEISLRFAVAPRWYETYWFYGCMFLVIAGGVYLAFLYRLRKLHQRERELSHLVDERTAEIQRQVKILDEQAREIEIVNSELKDKNIIIEEERLKSEQLLLNVLPPSIAQRLKHGERIIADKFESVTVLFADIVGFTNLSSRISPEHLVEDLSMIFTTFDALAAKYKLEKIKTIGDAYMVVGGLPDYHPDHVRSVARMAIDIQSAIAELTSNTDQPITVRVGIHTGPVVAGVIGARKFAYDLWGDTVNIASRMESTGEPGKIQCSQTVYTALQDSFVFEARGFIEIKGLGKLQTYFLSGENRGGN